MNQPAVPLFVLIDQPPDGSEAAMVVPDIDGDVVRFMARYRADGRTYHSTYTEWYPARECPVRLSWATFEWRP